MPDSALRCQACGELAPTDIAARSGDLPPIRDGRTEDELRAELERALGEGFTVRRLVGRGGFGEVWEAWDERLSRSVAVKVLRPELSASAAFRERFRREARAVARLRHPGIVPIYHVGESNGVVYFIMPLVEGVTLKAALEREGRLSHSEAVRILAEASAALREAHARGIVHRDLKPENVMLEGPEQRVLLMDFGIAQLEESGQDLTGAGLVLGSPEYMSPEQATGVRLDGRSDIYSLGVVGYHMLAGRLPFRADSARELLAKHVLTPPEPLATHGPMPAALAEAVMRCLAKHPDERWQSADEFVRALGGDLPPRRSEPAVMRRTSSTAETVRVEPVPVRRTGRSLALVSVLAVVAVAGAWTVQRVREARRWQAAATGVAAAYQGMADSLRALAVGFARGVVSGEVLLARQGELHSAVERQIAADHGPVLDDLDAWPGKLRPAVDLALNQAHLATLPGGSLTIEPSGAEGCILTAGASGTVLADSATRDNCWWSMTAPPALGGPAEYIMSFRTLLPPAPNAGVGLAWCATGGQAPCRVAFIWTRGRAEWAEFTPGVGIRQLQPGPRLELAAGNHRLRVRTDLGRTQVWLDERLVLERGDSTEAPLLARTGAFRVVVQNAAIELPGAAPLVVAGTRP